VKDRARVVDGAKNQSEKCKGSGGRVDEVKNRSGKCEGPGPGGGTNGWLKKKSFFKKSKT
jgi:hypothetical protein